MGKVSIQSWVIINKSGEIMRIVYILTYNMIEWALSYVYFLYFILSFPSSNNCLSLLVGWLAWHTIEKILMHQLDSCHAELVSELGWLLAGMAGPERLCRYWCTIWMSGLMLEVNNHLRRLYNQTRDPHHIRIRIRPLNWRVNLYCHRMGWNRRRYGS